MLVWLPRYKFILPTARTTFLLNPYHILKTKMKYLKVYLVEISRIVVYIAAYISLKERQMFVYFGRSLNQIFQSFYLVLMMSLHNIPLLSLPKQWINNSIFGYKTYFFYAKQYGCFSEISREVEDKKNVLNIFSNKTAKPFVISFANHRDMADWGDAIRSNIAALENRVRTLLLSAFYIMLMVLFENEFDNVLQSYTPGEMYDLSKYRVGWR